jgi:hypothetical protein
MNKKSDLLFEIDMPKKRAVQKRIKKIPLKQWEKWEMHETFIQALSGMDTDKVYVFKPVYRKGKLCYCIEQMRGSFKNSEVSVTDILFIKEYFEGRGWEVFERYFKHWGNSFSLPESWTYLYIKGRTE